MFRRRKIPLLRGRSSGCERRVSARTSVPTSVGLRGLIRLPLFDLGILVNRERVDSSVMNVREKVVVIMDCLLCMLSGKFPYIYHNIEQLPCFYLTTRERVGERGCARSSPGFRELPQS